jgi:hypothetical protein
MTCEKARKDIPLLAGGELRPRKTRRLRKHLLECSGCREELREYQGALAILKDAAREDELDWKEAEWKRLMAGVKEKRPELRPPLFGLLPKRAWTYGFIFLAAAGVLVLVFRGHLREPPVPPQQSAKIALTQPGRSETFNAAELTTAERLEDRLFAAKRTRAKTTDENPVPASALPGREISQDRLSVTLVSQETGLRVYWTFDKNFNWKEE